MTYIADGITCDAPGARICGAQQYRDFLGGFMTQLTGMQTLGCGPVATVEYPRIAMPMLVVRFPDGGSLSIEFTDQAPDDDHPRLGAWLELRAEDPAAVMCAALDAGLPQVKHPGHPYYFMAPGGQVFTVAPLQ